jgi:hypothetical protein
MRGGGPFGKIGDARHSQRDTTLALLNLSVSSRDGQMSNFDRTGAERLAITAPVRYRTQQVAGVASVEFRVCWNRPEANWTAARRGTLRCVLHQALL